MELALLAAAAEPENGAAMRLSFLCLAAFVFAGCANPAVVFVSPNYPTAQVTRVAVVGFPDYPGQAGSGDVVSNVLQQYMIPLGYNLIERQQVEALLKEQSFQISGAVDPATAQAMGKILGVDALIVGTVTDFSPTGEQTVMVDQPQESVETVSGWGRRGRGGDYTVTTRTDQIVPETETVPARVAFTVRLVSVATGTILWSGSASSDGSSASAAVQACSQSILSQLQKRLSRLRIVAR